MQLFVTILHIFLCLFLIFIILLQPGKEGAAAFGGGGSNQMYGPRGSGHFLGRATTAVAAMFMFTSITLALYSSARAQADSDIEDGIDQIEDTEDGFDVDVPAQGAATPAEPTPAVGTGLDALGIGEGAAPAEDGAGSADDAAAGDGVDVAPEGAGTDATAAPAEGAADGAEAP
ncbi:MAG: preprotein translocase subunit SecG [Alphaproteobacteria bacterium]|nr:preprotein translocase subunit SecG [Alphaproteobacteria bacterium]